MTGIRDDIMDAAAMVEALAALDTETAELVLALGSPARIAYVLSGWLAGAVAHLPPARRAAVVAGWREMGEDRGQGWSDYELPDDG